MTTAVQLLISNYYNMRRTREGGYPGAKMTFYDFIKFGILNFGHCDLFDNCDLLFVI